MRDNLASLLGFEYQGSMSRGIARASVSRLFTRSVGAKRDGHGRLFYTLSGALALNLYATTAPAQTGSSTSPSSGIVPPVSPNADSTSPAEPETVSPAAFPVSSAKPEVGASATKLDGVDERSVPDVAMQGELGQALARWLAQHAEIECDARSSWIGVETFVACGADGYLVLGWRGHDFVLQGQQRPAGVVTGFFEQGGKIWAQVVEERAIVVGRSSGEHPSPVAPPAERPQHKLGSSAAEPDSAERREWPTGSVVGLEGLEARVDMGAADGVEARMRVAFGESMDVVGVVTRVDAHESWVSYGVNERVELGQSAAVTELQPTASRTAPPRLIGLWELRAMLRPMLNLGSVGGGVLGEFSAGYRTRYFHVGALLGPFGAASADDRGTATLSGHVFGAFDSRVFSAGVGVGGQTVNEPELGTEKGSGIGLVQLLRLGAVDGLHLMSRTKAVIFRQQTEFSSLEVQGQVSVARDSWLIFRGGGGSEGYGYGEVAVRNLLEGHGGSGSFFLEVSIGGAALFERSCSSEVIIAPGQEVCRDANVGGPIAGLGAEWRL